MASRLKASRQRSLFIIFALIAGLSFYLNGFLKPALTKISKSTKQEKEYRAEARLLAAQFPDLNKAKAELDGLRRGIDELALKAANIENRLLDPAQLPLLLTEMIKCAQGLSLDFQSIEQKQEDNKDGFSRVYIDLKYEGSYADAINYIKRAEEIGSPFVKVEKIDLGQSKADPGKLISASLSLSAILARAQGARVELWTPATRGPEAELKLSRSPFAQRFIPGQLKTKALKLAGITYRADGAISTAIINDTVVKAGDELEGQKVEKILFDSVVLNDGIESRELKIER